MRPTLGTGLCFFVTTYKNDLISVGGQKKTQTDKKKEHFRYFCSHSVLPTKMTYGYWSIFVFLSPIAVGYSVLPTKMTYGNLFIFVFLESHSGWPNENDNL